MSLASRIAAALSAISLCAAATVLITYTTVPLANTEQTHFDALIVLGSPADPDGKPSVEQRERVMEGVREFRAHRAEHLILTGAAVHNQWVEAEVMAQVATSAGVPPSAIITETQARNTIQNLYFARQIMARQGWSSAEVISNPSHLRRAALILQRFQAGYGFAWSTHASAWPAEYSGKRRAIYWTYEAVGTTKLRLFGFGQTAYLPSATLNPMRRSQIRTVDDLRGPAGRLEAILNTGIPDPPYTALITHPHPPSGGTMHTRVVYHVMKAFSHFGLPVLRFNFRGTGGSEGVHDEGRGEVDDTRAALSWLTLNFKKPILFAGFSFGANVGLRACCEDPRVKALVGLGLPVQAAGRSYSYDFLSSCNQPKLFISGGEDQFCRPPVLAALLGDTPKPWDSAVIPRADHFFQVTLPSPQSKLDEVQAVLKTWLVATLALEEPESA